MSQIQYFLGANSPQGFTSLYPQLIDPAEARAIYLLKGGPGCGKSSLLRRVARHAEAAGETVEYILCSGDPDSLDAISIPSRKTALADATAPHVLEPSYPGVVEEYVNLGACYDRAGLGNVRGEIISCMGGYKDCYRRVSRCLSAAAELTGEVQSILETDQLRGKMAKRAQGILARECKKTGSVGSVTQRFLSGVTCGGEVCLFGTVDAQCPRVYELEGGFGLSHLLLSHLLTGAVEGGYAAVACPCPTAPTRLEHLLLPDLGLAFVTGTPALPYPGRPYRRLRLDAMVDPDLLRHNRARLRFSKRVCAALVGEAVDALGEAKTMHDRLEALYNPHVDFQAVYRTADDLAAQILGT